jgi:hypothetical protein
MSEAKSHALSGLIAKHAEIAGRIEYSQDHLHKLLIDLDHLTRPLWTSRSAVLGFPNIYQGANPSQQHLLAFCVGILSIATGGWGASHE